MEEEKIKPKINHIEVYIDVRVFFYKMTLRKIKKYIYRVHFVHFLFSPSNTQSNLFEADP
jgi:hypothetical protein